MRNIVWFSCGAASAVASKMAQIDRLPNLEVVYCDTSSTEHPDNLRFMEDVEKWIHQPIIRLHPRDYTGYEDIWDVFDRTGWLVGPAGARCTTELKKKVRQKYQKPDDVHFFGFTTDEVKRSERFVYNNPELNVKFNLITAGISKKMCYNILIDAGITLPTMYLMGYKNNNCIGCVKGGMGYWNKIRVDFPDYFNHMAQVERKMNVKITKKYFLDELPPNAGRYDSEPDFECGVVCGPTLTDN